MSRGQKFQTYSAQQIIDAIADRFGPTAYAFLPQVRDSTGVGNARTADALAMSLWPSRGLELHGFEVKVARNDWLRELKNPEKAEAIGQFCHRWWIVAPDKLVKIEELPPLWGLLVARGKTAGLVQVKAAELQPDVTPIDVPFLAAILRRAAADCPYARRKTREYQDGLETGKRQGENERTEAVEDLKDLEERLKTFEEASGIRIAQWGTRPEKLGAAVKVLTSRRIETFIEEADRVATFVETQALRARETANELAEVLNGEAVHG